MAKVITENFRSETSKLFYDSIIPVSDLVEADFGTSLSQYNTQNSLGLSQSNVDDISNLVGVALGDYVEDNNYYIFASSIDSSSTIRNSPFEKREFLRRVIFGNKITKENLRFMFSINNWTSGIVYDAYTDKIDPQNLNMFVTVLEGELNESSYRVFKCLDNNEGAESTIEPSYSALDSNYEIRTSDGYVWKYMFEVPAGEYIVYQIKNQLPYVPDTDVSSSTYQGISDILITNTDNELFSSLVVGDCTIVSRELIDTTDNIYEIVINTTNAPRSTNDAYKNMYLRIVNSGKLYEIRNSAAVSVSTNRLLTLYVQTTDDLVASLEANQECQVVPKIEVTPSSNTAIAYGVLNEFGTLIDVRFSSKGSGYNYATAQLVTTPVLGATTTTLETIISPKGGHGSDPIVEMSMSNIGLSTTIYSGELVETPDSNTYTKIGLVKNPVFTSGSFQTTIDNRALATANGDISSSISANQYMIKNTSSGQTVTARIHDVEYVSNTDITNVYLVDYVGDFTEQFQPGDEVLVQQTLTSTDSETIVINTIEFGDYEEYSGDLMHFIDFDPIQRTPDRVEKVKMLFNF